MMAFHLRSNSFPYTSDSFTQNVEDQLRKLRSSEATTSSSSSSDLVCQNLDGLKCLYESVNNWLQLPHMQQTFSNKQEVKYLQVLMNGSLSLLDLCNASRDIFSQMKGSIQNLESSLRRKNGQDLSLTNETENYFRSRKMVSKMVQKCSIDFKRVQKCNMDIVDKDSELCLLGQVEAVSFTVFESLLSFVCPPKTRSKSFLSKLINSKRVSCEGDDKEEMYGIEQMYIALNALKREKSNKSIHDLQKGLEALESIVKELEEGLEFVFRCVLKTRVSLLNIVNH